MGAVRDPEREPGINCSDGAWFFLRATLFLK